MIKENENMEKKSTIQTSEELRNALKDLGKKGESYENIIWRLIDNKDRRQGDLYNSEELKKIDKESINETLQDLEGEVYSYNEEIDPELNTEGWETF